MAATTPRKSLTILAPLIKRMKKAGGAHTIFIRSPSFGLPKRSKKNDPARIVRIKICVFCAHYRQGDFYLIQRI